MRWVLPSGVTSRSLKKPSSMSHNEGVPVSSLPAMASAMARNCW